MLVPIDYSTFSDSPQFPRIHHHKVPRQYSTCKRPIYASNKSKRAHLHNRRCWNCLLVIIVVNSLALVRGIIELN